MKHLTNPHTGAGNHCWVTNLPRCSHRIIRRDWIIQKSDPKAVPRVSVTNTVTARLSATTPPPRLTATELLPRLMAPTASIEPRARLRSRLPIHRALCALLPTTGSAREFVCNGDRLPHYVNTARPTKPALYRDLIHCAQIGTRALLLADEHGSKRD